MATWLVTGANRGLGLEWTRQLASRGESVIATARKPAGSEALASLGAEVHPLDVAEPGSVAELARALGARPIDVLVNNAGRGGSTAPFDEIDWSDVARFFQVNTIGPMRLTQALLPNLHAGSRKLIVNVTSRMGSIGDNSSGGHYGYRASKAALNMMTRSLALDAGRTGLTCVAIHPGWVATDMGGAGAPLSTMQSVTHMLGVVDRLAASDNGRFLDHQGATIPW